MELNKTAIIVPCYNEALRLKKDAFLSFAQINPHIDLWLINDGSLDGTLALLQELNRSMPGNIFFHDLPGNVGKAEAIRQGVLLLGKEHRYAYIGFLDADLSAPLEEALPLISMIMARQLKIVAGARVKLIGKTIHRSAARHYFGRIFATYQDTLLSLGNYDTQCGLKIFENSFAMELFRSSFVSNWFFDIELFVRAKKILGRELYDTLVAEVPLNEWKEVKGSKLKMTDFLKAPFEVLKIYREYK
ncbi:MAG: glycosyltransferase [Chitinophagaceae bacterium]|nr:glycosyltransferase [Chitinophagaceae bacterium]